MPRFEVRFNQEARSFLINIAPTFQEHGAHNRRAYFSFEADFTRLGLDAAFAFGLERKAAIGVKSDLGLSIREYGTGCHQYDVLIPKSNVIVDAEIGPSIIIIGAGSILESFELDRLTILAKGDCYDYLETEFQRMTSPKRLRRRKSS